LEGVELAGDTVVGQQYKILWPELDGVEQLTAKSRLSIAFQLDEKVSSSKCSTLH
jgi:hypothetical protein